MIEERFAAVVDLYLNAWPFQPFTMVMVSGRSYEVDHRGAMQYDEGTGVYTKPGGTRVVIDHESVSEIIGDIIGIRDDEN